MKTEHHPCFAITKFRIVFFWAFFSWLAFPVLGHSESTQPPVHPQTYAFLNGQWFTGRAFLAKTMYSVNGRFTHTPPLRIEKTFDLKNGFVVPPFGEAHTHNVEGIWNIDSVIRNYLRDGIFYVKNPNNISDLTAEIRHKLNRPNSIDVTFAHAGLTGQNGHPIDLYEDLLRIHRYEPAIGKLEKGWFNGRAYFSISSAKDLKEQWQAITASKPDFIKVYLANSEHFGTSSSSSHQGFRKGLDPRMIGSIVTRAHQQNLRVSAHIETAADFRNAIHEGVDEIAHMPGWFLPSLSQREAVRLRPEDAQLAAQHQVVIVTTTVAAHFHPHQQGDSHHALHSSSGSEKHTPPDTQSLRDATREIQSQNLRLLHDSGVRIAIGSDHAETSLAEALHLFDLGIFDNLTLLKMWSETTPQTIFPTRKIGRLDEGFEASFVVLANNPIENFRNVETITFRFKQGVVLSSNSNEP